MKAAAASTDAERLNQALAGAPAAFEAIMRRHNRLLFRSARGVVGNDAKAQDVVQEAYLHDFTTLHRFRGDAALGTWLARIAINIALDVQRRQRRSLQARHGGQDADRLVNAGASTGVGGGAVLFQGHHKEHAAALEKGAVAAYLGAVPVFTDRALAQVAASILGDEAQHLAVLRQVLGETAVPTAFMS